MNEKSDQEKLYSDENLLIGVLGGTFDPPHIAHIHMAQQAKIALSLDYVVFMPCGIPPHKKRAISQSEHRINMLRLMLQDYDDFYIDTYEAYNDKPSYTVDSVVRIENLLDDYSNMYFIIGADSLMYLDKWYDAKRLMAITNFAVIPRAGFSKEECLVKIKWLEDKFDATIIYIDTDAMNLSSTEIRDNTDEADKDRLTNEKVLQYIKENDLYI